MIPDYILKSDIGNVKSNDEREILKQKAALLNEKIQKDIEQETDPVRLNVLKDIQRMPSSFSDYYEEKKYVYNDGKFRTIRELEEYNQRKKMERNLRILKDQMDHGRRYVESGEFEEDCRKGSKLYLIPIAIYSFIFLIFLFNWEEYVCELVFSLFFLPIVLIISLIIRSAHSAKCIKLAEENHVSKNNEIVKRETQSLKASSFGLVLGSLSAFHTVKKETDSLMNPEHWNILN